MNMKEARVLQSRLKKELAELREQRDSASVVEMLPSDDFHDYINDTPETLSERINETLDKLIAVEDCIRKANTLPLDIPGYPNIRSLGELVSRVIQYRQELKYYRSMAAKPKREQTSGYRGSAENTVRVTTFPHELAVEKRNHLTVECERMSLLIEKLDLETEIDCAIE